METVTDSRIVTASSTVSVNSSLPSDKILNNGKGHDSVNEVETDYANPKGINELASVDSPKSVASQDETEDSKGLDILGTGRLIKKVIVAGAGVESRAQQGDLITGTLKVMLKDGVVVSEDTLSFVSRDGDVISGLDIASAFLEKGEVSELSVSSDFAYGEIGLIPQIPENSDLVLIVTVDDIKPLPLIKELSLKERLLRGEAKRNRGNFLYDRANFSFAINSYTKAIRDLEKSLVCDPPVPSEDDETIRERIQEDRLKCYCNLSAAQIKMKAYDAAIKSCDSVLVSNPKHVKALYRKGYAFSAKCQYEEALPILRSALKEDPTNETLRSKIQNLNAKVEISLMKQRKVYSRMFGTENWKSQIQEYKKKEHSWNFYKPLIYGSAAVASILAGASFFLFRRV